MELSRVREGWLSVEITPSCLQLALSHARSSNTRTLNCFLIATSWINEGMEQFRIKDTPPLQSSILLGETIVLEVNRFDPGRPNKERTAISPTSLMPGDTAVEAQVKVILHCNA